MDFYVLMQVVPVGGYISLVKVLVVLVFAVIWWRLLTWLDKDVQAARLPRETVNLGMVGGFVLAFLLVLLLPGFWIALPVFLLIFGAEIGIYLGLRSKQVGLKDLKAELQNIKLFGSSGKVRPEIEDVPGMVSLATKDGRHMPTPPAGSPERQTYDLVQMMVTEPLRRGMERMELIPTEATMTSQYWVDGVVYTGSQFSKAGVAAAVTMLKRLAMLDMNEKRKPQAGIIQATVDGKRLEVQVQTAGSASGESLRLVVAPKHRHDLKLEQLGLTAAQLQVVQGAIRDGSGGVVLIAVPKGQGLTSIEYGIIRQHDAFLTHIHAIERDAEDDLEGVTQDNIPKSASPQDELEKTQWVISQEPDAILMASVQNPKSARELVAFAEPGKRVYIGLRSASAVDAINDWRTLIGDDDLAMKSLRMVIAGRVVRKLCPACKQPYQPDPETLRKFNLDHAKSQQFFQARTQPMRDQKGNLIPCTFCAEMRYKGRQGVYEVMEISEEIRQAVLQNATAKQLMGLFRKMRGRFLQEQALDLVEQGVTGMQEVIRAMRGQEQDPSAAKAGVGSATGTFSAQGTQAGRTGTGQTSQGSRPGRTNPGTGRPPAPGR
jgi:general secretion pathway protein E